MVDYYESRGTGLGAELEDEIDDVLEAIVQFPRAAPQWRHRPDRRIAARDRLSLYPRVSDQGRRDRYLGARAQQPPAGLLVTAPLRRLYL